MKIVISCRYCMVACPCRASLSTRKGHAQTEYYPGQGLTEHEKIGKILYPHQVGVVQKCVFCKERVDAGLAGAAALTAMPVPPV
jgi:Fe-S-cluster-containing dehydrogenase component